MAEPGDGVAATPGGDHGGLRASHTGREQAIEALKVAFVQGRLTRDELDTRVSQALAGRTCAELAALTADLPSGMAAASLPSPAGAQGGKPVLRAGPVITTATTLYLGVWVYAVFFPKGSDGPQVFLNLTFGGRFFYVIILALCVGQTIALRRARHSGVRSTGRPGTGADGRIAQHPPSSDPGQFDPGQFDPGQFDPGQFDPGQSRSAGGGQPYTAEAARSGLHGQKSSGSRPGRPRSTPGATRMPRGARPVPGTT